MSKLSCFVKEWSCVVKLTLMLRNLDLIQGQIDLTFIVDEYTDKYINQPD